MYDLANQSFQLLINTLLFSLFVKHVLVADPQRGNAVWSGMVGASLLLIVVLSPVVGAIADHRAWKRELLLSTGVVCAALTACLAILQPGQVWLGAAIYVVAAVCCGLGENFLGSFLPEISTPRNVGFVSALGWTMSYAGALVLLGLTGLYVLVFDRAEPAQARPMFVMAGLWFGLGILPAVFFLREKARPVSDAVRPGAIVAQAFRRLAESMRQTRRYRQLARFFAIFFVYSLGTQTVIYFLGVIGDDLVAGKGNRDTLGTLIVFALVIALTAGASSAAVARFQDRLGHRRTVRVFLMIWVVGTLAMAWAQYATAPRPFFWAVSACIGVALGGIGTSSRALVGSFTPADRAAEFFGLWGMVYKLSGLVGVLAFGLVTSAFDDRATGNVVGMLLLAAAFLAGFVLLGLVDEREGRRAAGHDDA